MVICLEKVFSGYNHRLFDLSLNFSLPPLSWDNNISYMIFSFSWSCNILLAKMVYLFDLFYQPLAFPL